MKAVILAGGEGTRLRPFTYSGPKQMIKVMNKPLLVYNIEQVMEAGIQEVVIVTGNWLNHLREELGDGEKFGIRIEYAYQAKPLGLAHAVKCARAFLNEGDFMLVLGDNLLTEGLKPTMDDFFVQRPSCLVNLYEVEDPCPYGVAVFKDNKLVDFVEKPKKPPSKLALVGVYVFTSDIWGEISYLHPSWRGEYEITDAIAGLMKSGKKVSWRQLKGEWIDTGKRDDWLRANHLMLERHGKVMIGEYAEMDGSVILEPSIIGDSAVIRNSTVGPFVSIGDGARIVNSTIEESIVLDNAVIEDVKGKIKNSIIGKEVVIKGAKELSMTVGDHSIVEVA